jgi:UDP-2,3-diacylglucosamine hydrolase
MDHGASSGRPIGILAGNGSLPREIAAAAHASGRAVHIVALDGDIDPGLADYPLTRLAWGQMGRLFATLHAAGCKELVVVGGVTRPDLFQVRPDWGFVSNIPRLLRVVLAGGDDGVLRAMLRFLEANGFSVVGPETIAASLLVAAGPMGDVVPNPADAADMILGAAIVRALGRHDIGQGVIVANGELIAIEAVEGTDRMLGRVAALRSAIGTRHERGGVLVKRPKLGQELRIDLPTIGPLTVARATEAGLAGIAVLAGQTLAAERSLLVAAADAASMFVYGFSEGDEGPRGLTSKAGTTPVPWSSPLTLGRIKPTSRHARDLQVGRDVLGCLDVLSRTGLAVVNRGHVLALEPGGDGLSVFVRVGHLKQWGEGRWRRRTGVAVIGADVTLTVPLVSAAAGANLAGVAITGDAPQDGLADVTRVADQLGLFLARLKCDPRSKVSR